MDHVARSMREPLPLQPEAFKKQCLGIQVCRQHRKGRVGQRLASHGSAEFQGCRSWPRLLASSRISRRIAPGTLGGRDPLLRAELLLEHDFLELVELGELLILRALYLLQQLSLLELHFLNALFALLGLNLCALELLAEEALLRLEDPHAHLLGERGALNAFPLLARGHHLLGELLHALVHELLLVLLLPLAHEARLLQLRVLDQLLRLGLALGREHAVRGVLVLQLAHLLLLLPLSTKLFEVACVVLALDLRELGRACSGLLDLTQDARLLLLK